MGLGSHLKVSIPQLGSHPRAIGLAFPGRATRGFHFNWHAPASRTGTHRMSAPQLQDG